MIPPTDNEFLYTSLLTDTRAASRCETRTATNEISHLEQLTDKLFTMTTTLKNRVVKKSAGSALARTRLSRSIQMPRRNVFAHCTLRTRAVMQG